MMTFYLITSILLYALATGLLLRLWRKKSGPVQKKSLSQPVVLLAIIFHGLYLYNIAYTPLGLDIGFFSTLSFIAWLMATLLVIASLTLPVGCLGLLVYPFALLSLLLRAFSDQQHLLTTSLSPGLEIHILFSLLAYSLLAIAMAQALLLFIQDRYLHNHHPGGFLHSLPSLETMETLLFRIIGIGVIALTLSLLTGFIYLEDMFAQHLVHKTILSMIAWVVFVVLLWGHYTYGWRGKLAIRLSLSGFILLMLAYFGSKFVIELLLQ